MSMAGRACGRRLCERCLVAGAAGRSYCRAHVELFKGAVARKAILAVVGARNFRALHVVREHVLWLPAATSYIVSGRARGTDIVAEIAAHQRGFGTSLHPVGAVDGSAAFAQRAMARNSLLAEEASSADVFVTEDCRGSRDTIRKFEALRKDVRVHEEPPPAEHALLFHTAPHHRTRQAPRGYFGPDMLDVTRGSGGPKGDPFAPSMALLAEAKRRGRAEADRIEQLEAEGNLAFDVGDEATIERVQAQIAEVERSSFGWYEPRYIEEMRASWVRKRAAWDALLARNHVVLTCYCAPPAPGEPESGLRCHRRLLAEILLKVGPKIGRRVIYGGEVRCAALLHLQLLPIRVRQLLLLLGPPAGTPARGALPATQRGTPHHPIFSPAIAVHEHTGGSSTLRRSNARHHLRPEPFAHIFLRFAAR